MQIDGLSGGHSTSDHHVTSCIHEHHDIKKDAGGMAMKASAAAETSVTGSELQQEGQFSLSAWLKNTLGNSKGFLLNFWDGGQAAAESPGENNAAVGGTEAGQAAAQGFVHTERPGTVASAAAMVQLPTQQDTINNRRYNSGMESAKRQKRALWKRARDYFHGLSRELNNRRSQRRLGFQVKKSSSQAGRERFGEEELRRQSRFRRDTVEISVARTEDNYLMDSYDRKGEYSRLTTKK